MTWRVIYHHEVADDLEALGRCEARAVLRTIEERIRGGEPDKSGRPLTGELAGCRRIRSSDVRIIYRVDAGMIEVLIIAWAAPQR